MWHTIKNICNNINHDNAIFLCQIQYSVVEVMVVWNYISPSVQWSKLSELRSSIISVPFHKINWFLVIISNQMQHTNNHTASQKRDKDIECMVKIVCSILLKPLQPSPLGKIVWLEQPMVLWPEKLLWFAADYVSLNDSSVFLSLSHTLILSLSLDFYTKIRFNIHLSYFISLLLQRELNHT